MKTKTINPYSYDELSKEAKERALRDWNETNDNPLMQSHMINVLKEKLEERKIKYDVDSIDVRYSLSNCQGDGFMFEGILYDDKDRIIKIKHVGRYYHSYSKEIDYPEASERDYANFEKVYQSICKEMEQIGYDEIEYQQSEEYFKEECEANDYTFEESGKMNNL